MFHVLGVALGDEGFPSDKPANRERVGVQASAGETLIGAVEKGQLMLVISAHLSQALPLLLSEIYASGIAPTAPIQWVLLSNCRSCPRGPVLGSWGCNICRLWIPTQRVGKSSSGCPMSKM
ncbi:hypothetical protein MPTK1_3g11490 [Marchantia polymorpha subsp. ruderalis]|uniref:Uncharacterized protein n=2 Tax=Marchantia polymorpha TaxID=3197 RepID=A0AAF6AZQ4_MARPO|nr:hypothetical protein MARPO_0037s0048 [Marchantia polymorpha]BBN05238.1 hypothetical protein Mp_3g11490 [Marchantia polymorpha subsp. ruderalis]|eukprot:PTQ40867.1 hypothetical protein MARPO_0037s0048 [Marchantia polymorpha]